MFEKTQKIENTISTCIDESPWKCWTSVQEVLEIWKFWYIHKLCGVTHGRLLQRCIGAT